MRILTPTGYRDLSDCVVGDEVSAFDMVSGLPITNVIEAIEPETAASYGYYTGDTDDTYVEPEFTCYRITYGGSGKTIELFQNQSIWRNAGEVVHAHMLVVGDTLYDDADQPVAITAITPFVGTGWTRLRISGDHSFIADGISLHNATRYWNYQHTTGADHTWAITAPTNWGSASNTANGSSVPGSSDDVFFDGVGGGANDSTLGANISIKSLDQTGYTNTLSHSASVTLTVAGSGITFKLAGTYTISADTSALTFSGTSGTNLLTSGGKLVGNVTFSGNGGTHQLQDNWSVLNTTQTATLTRGTLQLNGKTFKIGSWSATSSNTRNVTVSGGIIELTDTGTIWNMANAAGFTVTSGPIQVNVTTNTATSRTINHGTTSAGTESNSPNVAVSAGSGTVTIGSGGSVGSLVWTGFTGTWASTSVTLYGSLTLATGMTITTGVTTLTFGATSGTKTITSNSKTLGRNVAVNGVGGTLQFADTPTFTSNNSIAVTSGTLDTNNLSFTINGFTVAAGGSLTLGSSTITNQGGFVIDAAATVSAGTSTIVMTAAIGVFGGGSHTYYDLNFTPTSSGVGASITGTNTFHNVTLTPFAYMATGAGLLLGGNQTVNSLSTSGTSVSVRFLLCSDVAGTPRTITAASVSLADIDFSDITGAGAATWTGTRLGDAGGNSGITLTTPANKYWVGNTANWNAANVWATSSGGAGATNNFPLPQDTCIFDTNSFSANNQTVTANLAVRIGPIDFTLMTNRTGITFSAGSLNPVFLGNVTFSTAGGFTQTGTQVTFSGRTTQVVTSHSVGFGGIVALDAPLGTLQFADNFSTGSGSNFTLTNGIVDLAGSTATIGVMNSSNTNARTLKDSIGGGKFVTTVTATSQAWGMTVGTGATIDRTNSWSIEIGGNTANIRTFAGGGLTYPLVTFTNTTANGGLSFTGSNTFKGLSYTGGTAQTISFTAGTTTTVETNQFFRGTAGNIMTIGSITASSHTLAKTGGDHITSDYVSVSFSTASPSSPKTWFAGPLAHSTDGGNNSGWNFTAAGLEFDTGAVAGSYSETGAAATTARSYILPSVGVGFYSETGSAMIAVKGTSENAVAGSYILTGVAATFNHPRLLLATAGAIALTGVAMRMLHGYLVSSTAGSYSESGQVASLLKTYLEKANTGSYAETGAIASLIRTRLFNAAAASYAETGSAASLLVGTKLAALASSYVLTGFALTMTVPRPINAAAGSYLETGAAASVVTGRLLKAITSSYAVTGDAATMVYTPAFNAAAGAYAVTGDTATFLRTYIFTSLAGSYLETGVAAQEALGHLFSALAGSFALTGTAAQTSYNKAIRAITGSYAVTGTAINLHPDYPHNAAAANYVYTGLAANLLASFVVGQPGAYSLTGAATNFLRTRMFIATAGSILLTGAAVAHRRGYNFSALAGSLALTGIAASLLTSHKIPATLGMYAVTGDDAALLRSVLLKANPGSYTLTGAAVTNVHRYVIAATQGSLNTTGVAASLLRGYLSQSTAGSFSTTGSATGETHQRLIPALLATFAVTGATASLFKGSKIGATAGSYTETGSAITAYRTLLLKALAGSFSMAGSNAGLLRSLLEKANTGSYAETGAVIAALTNKSLPATAGSFALTGSDVRFIRDLAILQGVGNYILAGLNASLLADRPFGLGEGSYSQTGDDVTILIDRELMAGAGSNALTGAMMDMKKDLQLKGDPTAYVYTGDTANIHKGKEMRANIGGYVYTGTAANIRKTVLLQGNSGNLAIVGGVARLTRGLILPATQGTFNTAGAAINFLRDYLLHANPALYTLIGKDIEIQSLVVRGSTVFVSKTGIIIFTPRGSITIFKP